MKQSPVRVRLEAEIDGLVGAGEPLSTRAMVARVELEGALEELFFLERTGRSSLAPEDQRDPQLRAVELRQAAERISGRLREELGPERGDRIIALVERKAVANDFEVAAEAYRATVEHRGGRSAEAAEIRQVSNDLLAAAERLFKSEGVAYGPFVTSRGRAGLLIRPPSVQGESHGAAWGTQLNRVAGRVMKRFDSALSFCPEELAHARASGMWVPQERRISLSLGSIERLGLDPTGAHEVSHAYHFWLSQQGKTTPFDFELQTQALGESLSDERTGYQAYMHGTELVSHSLNLAFSFSEIELLLALKKPLEAGSVAKELSGSASKFVTLVEQSARWLERGARLLAELSVSDRADLHPELSWKVTGQAEALLPGEMALRIDVSLLTPEGVSIAFSLHDPAILKVGQKVRALGERALDGESSAMAHYILERKALLKQLSDHLRERVEVIGRLESQGQQAKSLAYAIGALAGMGRPVSGPAVDELGDVVAALRADVVDLSRNWRQSPPAQQPGKPPGLYLTLMDAFQEFWRRLRKK